MDICIATDNNYVPIMSVLILSILDNTNKPQNLTLHIFEYGMSDNNKNLLQEMSNKYNASIKFYSVDDYIDNIKKKINNAWANNNSYVTYARLYMSDLLDENIKQFIYLDCDTLVLGDLEKLYSYNMQDKVIAGVKDVLPNTYKTWMGFKNGEYYNAGALLINAKEWRKRNLTNKFYDYCNEHSNDIFPDQDALNILLKNQIVTLNPQYCVFYPEYSWTGDAQLKGYCGDEISFYKKNELEYAGKHPIIIHFTDSVIGRPWQSNNINPYSKCWMKYYNMLPKEMLFEFKPKYIGWKTKIYRMLYKILPQNIFCKIYYKRRNSDIDKKMEGKNI
jgi:lipopolysaccharide biosynthesis glycosyltransferase